jgi:PAS domain S-box-containing protein
MNESTQLENQLYESSEYIRTLFELAPDAMIVVNDKGEIFRINAQAESTFGYKREELIGQILEILIPDRYRHKHVGQRNSYFAESHTRPMGTGLSLSGKRKNGDEFPVDIMLNPLRSSQGNMVIAVIRDITKGKAAEEALRHTNENFRLLVSGVRDYAIFMLDVDGNVITWNEGAERNKGYKAAEIIGRHFSCFYVEEDIQLGRPAKELAEAIATGRSEDEGLRKRKDGSTFWANVVISSIKDEHGELIGFAKITRDLTEQRLADDARAAINEEKRRVSELNAEIEQQKRIEKALKEVTINLARSNADLQQFAYVASHDLQEPLRAVTGFLSLLVKKESGNLDADSQKYINHAVEGAHRMRALVNDLLTYARVESRGTEFEPVQLSKVLERVKSDLSVQIEENGALIDSDQLPTVTGDPTQLAQLFQNLIGNAIKFRSSQAPSVRIKCNRQRCDWLFSVQDNGRGFDMEHAERIFVIFQRLQGRESASGTGIGLALCKKIVERHNGKIWVESKPDQGSTFFFTLPQSNGDTKEDGNH